MTVTSFLPLPPPPSPLLNVHFSYCGTTATARRVAGKISQTNCERSTEHTNNEKKNEKLKAIEANVFVLVLIVRH